jgi:hypothetical protein
VTLTAFGMTIALAKLVNSSGLFLDICGALLIFRFGMPEHVSRTGTGALLLEGVDEAEIEKAKRYDRLGRLGIGLLIIGFVLQLLSNFL